MVVWGIMNLAKKKSPNTDTCTLYSRINVTDCMFDYSNNGITNNDLALKWELALLS